MKKCIVFDVDRTMIDSYMPEILSLQEAIMNVTGKNVDENQLIKISTLTTSDFLKSLNLNDQEISLVKKEWNNTYDHYEIKCFPKMKEIIQDLFHKGFVLAIITSRTMDEFHELDQLLSDILDCFKIIITSDLIKKPKPNRDSIDYLCNILKITPDDILYIGDSEIDKVFSQNCNIDFIPACFENKELVNEINACTSIDDLLLRIHDSFSS